MKHYLAFERDIAAAINSYATSGDGVDLALSVYRALRKLRAANKRAKQP